MNEKPIAFLYAKNPPSDEITARLTALLKEKYSEEIELTFVNEAFDDDDEFGFKLVVGSDIYDWTKKGRLAQLKNAISLVDIKSANVISLTKEAIDGFTVKALKEEVGRVVEVGDGIAVIHGLTKAFYGEILVFESGSKGMVQNITKDTVGCILFDNDDSVIEGEKVTRSEKIAGVKVSDAIIGRVVDALGNPIDGQGPLNCNEFRPIEHPAPGIVDRSPVKRPLETGILAIDSMFPIGRGQRELIIGDRQTGKTTIAVDTILNQKGKDVICIYVAIGQKASSVASLTEILRKKGALAYTTVVCASASDAAPLQYIAPYSGCAIGEYFMDKGKDVLIIYDDLSKHAVAYRSLSLLLDRSPGREAYPGDVFYLHSRLLERSAQMSDTKGGGSMTALPIVETQFGDVSAYIPTNIISITDGQIFLESQLFFSGQRPAVNVGLSVSRVGADAQTKAMKKASGTLRLSLAQYREMKIFTQFSSDLDEATKNQILYGESLMQLLCQEQHLSYSTAEQVLLVTLGLNKVFLGVSNNEVRPLAMRMVESIKKAFPDIIERLMNGIPLSDDDKTTILDFASKINR